jgi:hypothetical protein
MGGGTTSAHAGVLSTQLSVLRERLVRCLAE